MRGDRTGLGQPRGGTGRVPVAQAGSRLVRLFNRTAAVSEHELPAAADVGRSIHRLGLTASVSELHGIVAGWMAGGGDGNAGWLGRAYNPLTAAVEKRDTKDNPYWRDCTDEELAFQPREQSGPAEIRLDRRRSRGRLLQQFDDRRRLLDGDPALAAYDRFRSRALGLVSSARTYEALDLRREPAPVRERYGKHLFGQSCLMARRLVEAGVRFVTVHYDCCDGYGWDSHLHSDDVKDRLRVRAARNGRSMEAGIRAILT